mgnify:FL=1
MKDSFSSFVLRDLIALLSGLMLMLLHGTVEQGILTALVPQSAAPWELSKLVFWPLVICAAAGRVSRAHIPISRVLPSLVLAPLGMIILCRGALTLGYGGWPYATIWMAVLAAALAFGPDGRRLSYAWTALAVVLAGAYVLLALQPSLWRPFLLPGLAASVLFLAD